MTLGAMVLTAAANCLISGKWEAEPLPDAAWPEVFILSGPPMRQGNNEWVLLTIPAEKEDLSGEAYLIPILRDYDLEMRLFSGQNPPEAHLVKFFMFGE